MLDQLLRCLGPVAQQIGLPIAGDGVDREGGIGPDAFLRGAGEVGVVLLDAALRLASGTTMPDLGLTFVTTGGGAAPSRPLD